MIRTTVESPAARVLARDSSEDAVFVGVCLRDHFGAAPVLYDLPIVVQRKM